MSSATAMAGQETKAIVADLATISGCTNDCKYTLVIHDDGSAAGNAGAIFSESIRLLQFPPGTVDTKTLLFLLGEIGDVSRIPAKPCPETFTSGEPTTRMSYAGKTSGDLQHIEKGGDPELLRASEELARFLQTTVNHLKL